MRKNDFDKAEGELQVALRDAGGNCLVIAGACKHLALLRARVGSLPEAIGYLERSLEAAKRSQDRDMKRFQAEVGHQLGNLYFKAR